MSGIDGLLDEHLRLRALAAEIEAVLGPQVGVGWDDCSTCDKGRLKSGLERLLVLLKEHERREDALVAALTGLLGEEGRAAREAFREAHDSLPSMLSVLDALLRSGNGVHVHSLRVSIGRVREELEAHLAREERDVFPVLRRAEQLSAR